MSGKEHPSHWVKPETRLIRPDERLKLAQALSTDCVEEMRSLEIEREHDSGAERWQRLLRTDPRSDVMSTSARVNKGLVAERLREIESSARDGASNPWACDY